MQLISLELESGVQTLSPKPKKHLSYGSPGDSVYIYNVLLHTCAMQLLCYTIQYQVMRCQNLGCASTAKQAGIIAITIRHQVDVLRAYDNFSYSLWHRCGVGSPVSQASVFPSHYGVEPPNMYMYNTVIGHKSSIEIFCNTQLPGVEHNIMILLFDSYRCRLRE